jgi:3-methylfumaryl-CoA hydratase
MTPAPPPPSTTTSTDRFDLDRAIAIAQLLDRRTDDLTLGRQLPLAWHMCFFLPRPAQRDLGVDGHPLTGVPTPPEAGMRRMFAGGRITLLARIDSDGRCTYGPSIGDDATAGTEVIGDRIREGRSGPLRFVTTRSTFAVGGVDVLTDERDIVYLPARRERPPVAATTPAIERGDAAPDASPPLDHGSAADRVPHDVSNATAVRQIDVTPTLLFRFSALTYNAHRIHYDRDYARETEGYPGLVVHGPLQALLMAELGSAVTHGPNGDLAGPVSYTYKLTAPLYERQGMHVLAGRDDRSARAIGRIWTRVIDASGRETSQAEIIIGQANE